MEGKDMRNNLTELVFIIDRSGSMYGLEADTVGGFNSMLEKQKNVKVFRIHCGKNSLITIIIM